MQKHLVNFFLCTNKTEYVKNCSTLANTSENFKVRECFINRGLRFRFSTISFDDLNILQIDYAKMRRFVQK